MATQALGLKLPIQLGQNGYFDTNTATVAQVADNIKNLLQTIPGERRFNNEFGSSLYSLLFQQNIVEVNKDIIVDAVQRDIDRWLNGVLVNDVKVKLSADQPQNNDANSIFISVVFTYNRSAATVDVTLNTNRI